MGSVLSNTGRCQPDIFRQICIASSAMYSMNRVWRQTRLPLQTKLHLYQTCILPFSCTVRKPGRSWRKINGSSRPSICVASVWSLEYAGTILPETPRSSPPPIFPVSMTSSPRGETHCSVTWWDLTIILRLIVHCFRSRQLEPVPASTLAGTDAQAARATRGYSRSATVPPSASTLNGPRPPVVGIPGWRNGPLLATRSDDDNFASLYSTIFHV